MKKTLLYILLPIVGLMGCDNSEILNARIAGSYEVFVKAQSDYWFGNLAMNYTNDNEIDGFAVWDGESDPVEIRIEISEKNKKKVNFVIPDQEYDDNRRIEGDGILIGNTLEFYYIIGSNNLSRSYVMSGNK